MIDIVEKDNLYCFTQISQKSYLGRKLTTSKLPVARIHKSSQGFQTLYELFSKVALKRTKK